MSDFVSRNKQIWSDLEALINRCKKSPNGFTVEERCKLDSLYRQTTIHLSQVKTNTSDQNLIAYLNQLTAGAHSLIYLPPKKSVFQGAIIFILFGFARSIARYWRYHLAASLLFISGGLVAYYATLSDPLAGYALSAPILAGRGPGSSKEQLLSVLRSGREDGSGQKFAFASMLFGNNFKVAVLALATGILAAIPSILIMFYNGLIMGVFVAVHHQNGIYSEMWAWILPHGITEFGAIFLCGGVGILIGKSAIAPGDLSRIESLRRAAKAAGLTLAGAAGMLLFAAIIESYLRQSNLSTTSRLLFAAGTGLFWVAYIWMGFVAERNANKSVEV